MIKRNNLEEQLREYQIRSKNDWASVSFFASTSNLTSRHDVAISVLWGLVILAILVLSAALLYFTYTLLAVYFICFIMVLFVGLKVMKRANISKKRRRRMLLPLSI